MDTQLLKGSFVKSTKRQNQLSLAYNYILQFRIVSFAKVGQISNRRMLFPKEGIGRPQISDENKFWISATFNEGSTLSVQNAAAQKMVHHTTIWPFMRRDLKHFPYKLQTCQQSTDLDKQNWIYFEQCCPNELRDDPEFFNWIVFPMGANFLFLELWTNKNVRYEVQSVHNKYTKYHKTPALLWLCALCAKTKFVNVTFSKTGMWQKKAIKYSSLLYVSNTSRISGRHAFSIGWLFSSLCCYNA